MYSLALFSSVGVVVSDEHIRATFRILDHTAHSNLGKTPVTPTESCKVVLAKRLSRCQREDTVSLIPNEMTAGWEKV